MTAAPAPLASDGAPPLLAVESVDVTLGRGWRANQVLSGVDLDVWPGEIVGLVGETGSGKTTLARTVVGLVNPKRGRVVLDGRPVSALRRGARRAERRRGHVQLVFQDPLRSLDPDLTVAEIVAEGLRIRGEADGEIRRRVTGALENVGLDATVLERTPGQISGGQRQRVSIARALAVEPRLLICDEPVSALDASTRNYVLRLLDELRTSLGLAIVIISHDLSSLAGIADRVVVLYRGRIIEDGPVDRVFATPRHPYTALLMASAPSVRHDRPFAPDQLRRTGADPAPPTGPGACVFADRCRFAAGACAVQPPLTAVGERWSVACHRHRGMGRPRPDPPSVRKDRPMPVEFIGMISTRDQSEIRRSRGPVVDRDYVRRFARAHEDAGFDRVLIGYSSSQPDGTQVAAYAAAHTDRLSFLVAHRPGFVAPTLAARTFATLDQFTGGRIAVHIITGGSDGEQRRDGDHLSKDERYDRTDEYLDILVQAWTSDAPFGYQGRYYQVEDSYAEVRSPQQPRIPLYFGGSSDAGVPGRRQARRRLRPVGRAAGRDGRADRLGACRRRSGGPGRRPRGSVSRSAQFWVRPRNSPGSGRTRSWPRRRRTSRNSAASGAGRPGASAARIRRTGARSGCWPRRPRASCTTGRCGRRWPPPPAPPGTPPRWSGRRRPWPRPCSTTWTSA